MLVIPQKPNQVTLFYDKAKWYNIYKDDIYLSDDANLLVDWNIEICYSKEI